MNITSTLPVTPAPNPFRPRSGNELAVIDLPGVGHFSLRDSLTGYGRAQGYDSLANARRAAWALSNGADSPAAGVFQQGDRYYVRALVAEAMKPPHAAADDAAAGAALAAALLHFEGNDKAHFAWVRDSRLVLVVDGSTKVWSRDAHHTPPPATA